MRIHLIMIRRMIRSDNKRSSVVFQNGVTSELKIRRRRMSTTASGSEITARIISGCRRCDVSRRRGHVCNVNEAILPSRLKRE